MVLHVAGEVDTFAADGLREQFRRLATEPLEVVVVDLSDVTFMSCTALAVLAHAKAQFATRLVLGGMSRVVTRLLDMTGLRSFFPVLPEAGAGAAPDGTDGGAPGTRAADDGAPGTRATQARSWTFSRTDLHRARGVLMAVHGCDAEQAWSMLALAAARHGVPVAEVVDLLIRARRDPTHPPSPAAADAALMVMTRKLVDDPARAGDAVGCAAEDGPDQPTERLENA
ncbi:STAS domain-containing protein [Blastococcus sp. CT_GayMR19]|uniref:anti-sigma factor antagonist n=1 Tax=Blastococcus sp. CT_GayMR19 TaxID=2559608 RepID=UPI001072F661|nr:anti-sigma factor antagonist [Blastococcus sp. CT_GayMR19]TFV72956.1 STAS domain-containing protein [Blastococcus sp. CT_GayMR19]